MQKQVFRIFCKFITNKNRKYHIYMSIRNPLLSTLLTAITASSLHGMMLQAWHTCIWGVSTIYSLQILSSSVRLDGERHCTAIFRSLQRCLNGFKSRLWSGNSRAFRTHSCIVLTVLAGLLFCWKVNLRHSLRS